MRITREEAVEVIRELIEAEILREDLEDSLQEIIMCLEAEMKGRHEWGAKEEELAKIYTCLREDLWTDELLKECEDIDNKLRFVPSKAEESHFISSVIESFEESCIWDDMTQEEKVVNARKVLRLDK